MSSSLTTQDHRRDSAGLTYVYPVLSRRSGGISIGINVNTNNACNWRCIYCQVPNLIIGSAPTIDFALLESELKGFLDAVRSGDFYSNFQVPMEQQSIKDIAISGNGEPTSAKDFTQLIELVGRLAMQFALLPDSKLVLITNGSLVHQPHVQEGLKLLHKLGGEVWFKLDSATLEGRTRINNSRQSQQQLIRNLRQSIELCATKIQTCIVDFAEAGWPESEQSAYLELLAGLTDLPYQPDIMLYTLARPSLQPEAAELKAVSLEILKQFAQKIRTFGFPVSLSN